MWLFLPISDWSYSLVAQAQGKVPLKKELSEALFQEPGKGNSQDAGKASLLQGRRDSKLQCACQPLYLKQEGR